MPVPKKGKKLSAIVPAATLKDWGLSRAEIQNLTVDDLNDIGMMFMELNAKRKHKGGPGGQCSTGMCTTGVCTTGVCTCG
jgi:hypothetical protein